MIFPHNQMQILPYNRVLKDLNGLTADQIAHTFAIYPSLSGSVTEAARQLMLHDDL